MAVNLHRGSAACTTASNFLSSTASPLRPPAACGEGDAFAARGESSATAAAGPYEAASRSTCCRRRAPMRVTSSSDGLATAASASSGARRGFRGRAECGRTPRGPGAGVRRRRRRRSRGRRQLRRRQRLVGGLLRGRSPPPRGRACARRRGRRRRARHRAPQPAILERERGVARRKRPNELRRLRPPTADGSPQTADGSRLVDRACLRAAAAVAAKTAAAVAAWGTPHT